MLTFEEFFTKKKIDLAKFQQAEPALFAEFKKEFGPMGEKSFDHTKKFWFNKLRRLYHLKEEPKLAKSEITVTEIASQAEPLASPTMEQVPGFKPRFNMKTVAVKREPAVEKSSFGNAVESEKSAEKPAGSKPRFNMKTITVNNPPVEEKPEENKEALLSESDKPVEKTAGFKPRFSMKTVEAGTSSGEVKPEEKKEIPSPDPHKPEANPPAYKPKFNMKNIKPKSGG